MLPFCEVWAVDFEFTAPAGERPTPICMVAREIRSGRTIRLEQGQFGPSPPFSVGPKTLFVAFYASAELGCFLALNWPKPANILDLFAEFRDRTNGLSTPAGAGLIGALTFLGLDSIGAIEKDDMRAIAMRGGPFTESERAGLLQYCESDVLALEHLLTAMLPRIDLTRALVRGRYMAAAAAMEWNGTPIDSNTLAYLQEVLDRHSGRSDCGDRFKFWSI